MSRSELQRLGLRAIQAAIALTIVFGTGALVGAYLAPQMMAEAGDKQYEGEGASDADQAEEDEHEEEDHVALTEQAVANLGLRMGRVSKGDYWKTLLVPGRVVEIPGQSSLSISAPVTGVVEQVNLLPGQSIEGNTPLFTMRITDESLIDAQSKILALVAQQDVAQQEIMRLEPLIASGAVSGTRTRELQYEMEKLKGQQSALEQELSSRGMSASAIRRLLESKQLETVAEVFAPEYMSAENALAATGNSKPLPEQVYGYSVELMEIHPGQSVERGNALCTVAYHPRLYVVGTAFQEDLPVLERIAEEGWKVTVETHDPSHQYGSELRLDLLRLDNHVDEESQTVKFYLELPNQVAHTRVDAGRTFEQWRFRPGQRLHLRLPVEKWTNQVTLPTEAVVVDGPNIWVFAKHVHEELLVNKSLNVAASAIPAAASRDSAVFADEEVLAGEGENHDIFMELEPVPVNLLYRDDKTVVIADDGRLDSEEIALNNAYKLYLAMKMQAGGGGGHHHHDH
jgi:cobalt-zinc-cadmium efflux system membrane fusion protein